jgi:hypothetical protein
MIPDADGKPESRELDPEQLERMLELELMQKRAARKIASQRQLKVRLASFLFLFILIVGTLFAFFVLMSRVNEERANRPAGATPAARP